MATASLSALEDLDIPMGAFWDCIDNDAPNRYEYSTMIFNYLNARH